MGGDASHSWILDSRSAKLIIMLRSNILTQHANILYVCIFGPSTRKIIKWQFVWLTSYLVTLKIFFLVISNVQQKDSEIKPPRFEENLFSWLQIFCIFLYDCCSGYIVTLSEFFRGQRVGRHFFFIQKWKPAMHYRLRPFVVNKLLLLPCQI